MVASPLLDLSQSDGNRVGVPIVGFAACGSMVRRSAFLEAGGFEQRFGVGGEEQVLALDMLSKGWQLAYVDEIVAYHHPSPVRDAARRSVTRSAMRCGRRSFGIRRFPRGMQHNALSKPPWEIGRALPELWMLSGELPGCYPAGDPFHP